MPSQPATIHLQYVDRDVDPSTPIGNVAYSADLRYRQVLESLDAARETAQWQLDNLAKQIEAARKGEPHSINSLGVLQSTAQEVDRNAALLYAANLDVASVRYLIDNS
jgi:hypothetical protein